MGRDGQSCSSRRTTQTHDASEPPGTRPAPIILCATDLTARSDPAIQRASLLARQLNAKLLLVHSVQGANSQRAARVKIARAQARLLTLAEQIAKGGVATEVCVLSEPPLQAIQQVAKVWAADLIVMARPRERALDVLLGSTAERVIRATNRPVLVVNNGTATPYRNVVLATDLSKTSLHVARTIAGMGVLETAYTWIVHAFRPSYFGSSSGCAQNGTEPIPTHRRQWQRMRSQQLLQQLQQEGVDLAKVELIVEACRPFDAITRALQRVQSDLLVIGTSRWFMLKRLLRCSVADEVLRRVDCDVLAISPSADELPIAHAAQRPMLALPTGQGRLDPAHGWPTVHCRDVQQSAPRG